MSTGCVPGRPATPAGEGGRGIPDLRGQRSPVGPRRLATEARGELGPIRVSAVWNVPAPREHVPHARDVQRVASAQSPASQGPDHWG